jgi:hypothetical protein
VTSKRAAGFSKRFVVACMVFASCAHGFVPRGAANAFRKRTQAAPAVNKLRKADRERLIAARLQGKKEIMLLLAANPGMNASTAQELTNLGAVVRFREDTVDYLRARVLIDRVDDVARLSSVEAVALDGLQFYYTSQDMPVSQSKQPPPDANTPAENPYLPTADIGAPQFIRDHPTFDGRGVTIGNVDGNSPDILAPELQKALALDGTPVPKFSDVVLGLDPIDDDSPLRVEMSTEVNARDGRFEWKQLTYRTAEDGRYRLGLFDINAFGGGLLRTYLPQATKENNLLAVLWQEHTGLIWVDTNLNRNFADETALTDFNSSFRPGILGKDNPATPLRETVAFTILINSEHKLIYLAPLANGHATATASVAAGHNFFGGQMNGVAPAARIASALRKSVTHSFIETMILTVKNPKIDLVTLQWAARIPPMDGSSVLGIVFQRLVEKYKKPIFASADNFGPGLSTTGEPSVPQKVISVGAYVNKRTWQSNSGVSSAANDTLANLSARGPRPDGALKPDLVAPASVVAADFGVYESRLPPPFTLPPGYSAGAGTSTSAPMAAGAAALLISAAKQTGVAYDADRIAWALKSSARFLPVIGAHEQGNGLINVAAAWEALKRAPAPVAISSSAQINVAVGPYVKTPNHGPGIYEREGWQAGQSGQRTITFTRTSGSAQALNYVVRWTGNDRTFTSATNIRLPLNQPVGFPVTIDAKTPGAHSAILNLDDSTGARSVYQVLNTVIVAEQFRERENFAITREGSAEYPAYTSYFFNVPKNSSAFRIDLKTQHGSVRIRLMRPTGKEFDHAYDTPVRWSPEYQNGGNLDRMIPDPEPGVWQVILENQNLLLPGDAEIRRAKFTITATVLGAESKAQPELNTRVRAVFNKQQVGFTSYFAPFNGYYAESPLGSAFSTRTTITREDEPVVYEINVPPGAGTLKASIDGPATKPADADLYLYYCAKECELKAFSARGGVEEQVSVAEPKPGKWKIVIDPVSLPSGTLTLDYTDFFTHAAFGSLTALTTNVAFTKGATIETEFTSRIDSLPVNGRRLVGLVQLLTREPLTVRYEYNPTTKTIEPIKERVTLAETLLELHNGITKPKPLTGAAGR